MEAKEFWDLQHSSVNVALLTHTPPDLVFLYHRISPPPCGKAVLDLGVGNGDMSKRLVSLGNSVTSCDVSGVALSKVDPAATVCFTNDLAGHGPFDLAIMHLVSQHVSDDDLVDLLSSIRLSKNGVISMQSINGGSPFQREFSYRRTENQVIDIIERAGLFFHSCFAADCHISDTWHWRIWELVRR